MTEITSFAEAEAALARFIPLAREMTGKDITLDRMTPLMAAIGNPEKKLKIIHVAGTSGKTSTAYYIAEMLAVSVKKVGLTVSPHMDSVAERVQINTVPLSKKIFCELLTEFLDILVQSNCKPTYYELLMAFAYWTFAKLGVDYAVIETGVGGLYDASNVAKREDKVCIITDIGFDHMNVLGNTIEEISRQKAGIIHAGNNTFMHTQKSEVQSVFEIQCRAVGAYLNIVKNHSLPLTVSEELKKLPLYKQRNWQLAFEAYKSVCSRDGLSELKAESLIQTIHTYIPGRMDEVQISNKKIIMDGAHNGQKISSFVQSFTEKYPDRKVVVLLAMKNGKEYRDVLQKLTPIIQELIITSFSIEQDRLSSSVDVHEIADYAQDIGVKSIIREPNLKNAYEIFLNSIPDGDIGVITGSLYLLSQIRSQHSELVRT